MPFMFFGKKNGSTVENLPFREYSIAESLSEGNFQDHGPFYWQKIPSAFFDGQQLLLPLFSGVAFAAQRLPGKPVADTLWKSDGETLDATVAREGLFAVETPQLFDLELWKKAQTLFPDADLTDDAGLLRKAGFPVALVINPDPNIKLTTQADLILLRALI